MLDRTTAPEIHPIGNLQLPQAVYTRLDNGIKLCTYRCPNSHLTQLSVVVRGGQAEGRLPVISSILSMTITEGANGLNSEQIAAEIDFYGARLRAEASTHFVVLTLEMLTDKLPQLLPLFIDIMTQPTFDEEIFESFRDREAKALMHYQAQVAYLARYALSPLMVGRDNPYAHVPQIDEVMGVTRDEVVDFHRMQWVGRNITAYLFGEYGDRELALVSETLSAIPAGEERPLSIYPYHPESPQRVDVVKADAQQSAVRMGIPTVPRSHPDYLPLRFTVIALGGYFGSRLMKNIREDKGYTYGIQAALAGQIDGAGILINAQCDAAYVDAVITETAREMERLAREPISDDEMQRVKQSVATALLGTVDNAFTLADHYRVRILTGSPDDSFDRQVQLVHTITPADIMLMAQRYLDPAALRIATVGREAK